MANTVSMTTLPPSMRARLEADHRDHGQQRRTRDVLADDRGPRGSPRARAARTQVLERVSVMAPRMSRR